MEPDTIASLNCEFAAMSVNRDAVTAATARRLASTRKAKPSQTLYMPFDEEHDLRQAFRKRIDRDILGGNSPKSAIESLKVSHHAAQPPRTNFRLIGVTM